MAKGDPLPDGHHISRACGDGIQDGIITATAFDMRSKEKELQTISGDWVECECVPENERNFQSSVARLNSILTKEQPVVKLPVNEIRSINIKGAKLEAYENQSQNNPCHSTIGKFKNNATDLELQSEMAAIARRSPVIWINQT